ncbi:MAG: hypothetical protein K1563_16425 [Candidatus Thiodiazotropha sp. (ex. Lucinisca nassula)]|uniref:hypothetical protein n=1 Tax=Candidatus Thiodiazotropha sp. LNASS1 TaxID=3096260 RepID=UPI002813690B|nr:hypothetical protein [Candidatus Thiodiazotropha sp. (ex. Lucinisca nassula)]
MWNPFRSTQLLTEEDSYFQFECFKWLLTHFGGDDFYKGIELVLPTEEYFPAVVDSSESAAQTTFNQVKMFAGLEKWPVKLEEQEEDPNIHIGDTLIVQNVDPNPLGTFSSNVNDEIKITYNPKIVSDPQQMVATFAHELSHYLTGTAHEPPPGGWENWEFATDIGATFLGFGIFMANSAFSFRQYSSGGISGWQTSGSGYLSEAEHSYSLAVFLRLKEIPPEKAIPYCDRSINAYVKQALKEIDSGNIIQELRGIKYVPQNS